MRNSIIGVSLLVIVAMSGCGKTLTELRTDGNAVVDTGSSIVKKAFDAGVAVYEIVKKIVEDVKDNAITVKETVVGASQ